MFDLACVFVGLTPNCVPHLILLLKEPRVADYAAPGTLQHRQIEILFLFQWRKGWIHLFIDRTTNLTDLLLLLER